MHPQLVAKLVGYVVVSRILLKLERGSTTFLEVSIDLLGVGEMVGVQHGSVDEANGWEQDVRASLPDWLRVRREAEGLDYYSVQGVGQGFCEEDEPTRCFAVAVCRSLKEAIRPSGPVPSPSEWRGGKPGAVVGRRGWGW